MIGEYLLVFFFLSGCWNVSIHSFSRSYLFLLLWFGFCFSMGFMLFLYQCKWLCKITNLNLYALRCVYAWHSVDCKLNLIQCLFFNGKRRFVCVTMHWFDQIFQLNPYKIGHMLWLKYVTPNICKYIWLKFERIEKNVLRFNVKLHLEVHRWVNEWVLLASKMNRGAS